MNDWTSEDGAVRLICGDCLQILPTLAPGSVDAVVTDPPYSSGGAFRSDRSGRTASKYLGSYNSTTAGDLPEVIGDSRDALGWAFWATLWLARCYEATKAGGRIATFTDWRQLPNCTNAIQAAGWVWRGLGVWDKGGSCRPMSGRFAHQSEFFVWGTKGPIGWDYSLPSAAGVFRSHVVPSKQRAHQTEKPVEVVSEMLTIMPGIVLDPFMGSGTTGVACVNTGRRFVGIELDAGYFEIAKRRIQAAMDKRAEQLIPAA
jgi:site-specific DNA-methyltransferase (adenine-specific)